MQIEVSGNAEEIIRQQLADGAYSSPAEVVDAMAQSWERVRMQTHGEARAPNRDRMTDEERGRLLQAIEEVRALPLENAADTFSGADHDEALYASHTKS